MQLKLLLYNWIPLPSHLVLLCTEKLGWLRSLEFGLQRKIAGASLILRRERLHLTVVFASHLVSGSVGTRTICSLHHPVPYPPPPLLTGLPCRGVFLGTSPWLVLAGQPLFFTEVTVACPCQALPYDAGLLLPQSGGQNLSLLFASAKACPGTTLPFGRSKRFCWICLLAGDRALGEAQLSVCAQILPSGCFGYSV